MVGEYGFQEVIHTVAGSTIIRVPACAKTPAQKRFELRSPDAACNPYYAYAAILMGTNPRSAQIFSLIPI